MVGSNSRHSGVLLKGTTGFTCFPGSLRGVFTGSSRSHVVRTQLPGVQREVLLGRWASRRSTNHFFF